MEKTLINQFKGKGYKSCISNIHINKEIKALIRMNKKKNQFPHPKNKQVSNNQSKKKLYHMKMKKIKQLIMKFSSQKDKVTITKQELFIRSLRFNMTKS